VSDLHYVLHISADAFDDTNEIALWYEKKVKDLGEKFLEELEDAYKSILSHPTYFPRHKKAGKIRKKLLKIFLIKFSALSIIQK
jgi:hypothetical protein